MRALVVVESVFGNTRRIADAIGTGLAGSMDVQVVDVADAEMRLDGVDLLVIGGPTHAFSMTRRPTRRAAAEQSGGTVAAVGLREWLRALTAPPMPVATFDTRIDTFRVPGSAAKAATRALRRLGHHALVRPETFRVAGTQGPLREGELDRARAWGAELAARLTRPLPA